MVFCSMNHDPSGPKPYATNAPLGPLRPKAHPDRSLEPRDGAKKRPRRLQITRFQLQNARSIHLHAPGVGPLAVVGQRTPLLPAIAAAAAARKHVRVIANCKPNLAVCMMLASKPGAP